jgi:hypothetical protein
MSANDKQIAGTHYSNKAIQPWDFITSNNIGYLEGNVIKYISRWKEKGGVNDLLKAQHYLEKLLELQGIKKDTQSLVDEVSMLRTHINQGIEKTCGFFCALPECAREQQKSQSF